MNLCSLFLNTLSFWLVWDSFYSEAEIIIITFYRRGNWLIAFMYMILLFAFTRLYGGYKIGTLRLSEVIYSQWLSLFFVNSVAYLQISLIGRQFLPILPLAIMTLFQLAIVVPWGIASNKLRLILYPPREMLMIYGSNSAHQLENKMSLRSDKYNICERCNANEDFESIKNQIDKFECIVICDVKSSVRNKILKYCFDKSKPVYLTPKITDIIISGAQNLHLFDTPLIVCSNDGLSISARITKRFIDITGALLGIIILSPIMLAVAVTIKIHDHGGIIYSQERLTRNGKVFRILKFRTMIENAENDGIARLSAINDERITPLGRILRKFRIDELPQLFNILKGDMSIVGPRPERPEIAEKYCEHIPEFQYRLKVKAGLTGYAQVLGKYNTSAYDKLKLDLMYTENYSLFMDIRLMLMTAKTLFIPESTEGLPEESTLEGETIALYKDLES